MDKEKSKVVDEDGTEETGDEGVSIFCTEIIAARMPPTHIPPPAPLLECLDETLTMECKEKSKVVDEDGKEETSKEGT